MDARIPVRVLVIGPDQARLSAVRWPSLEDGNLRRAKDEGRNRVVSRWPR